VELDLPALSDWSTDGTSAKLLATVQGASSAKAEVEWDGVGGLHDHPRAPVRRHPQQGHRGLDRTTRFLVIAPALSSRLITRSVVPEAV
jgi:hypothetical protein